MSSNADQADSFWNPGKLLNVSRSSPQAITSRCGLMRTFLDNYDTNLATPPNGWKVWLTGYGVKSVTTHVLRCGMLPGLDTPCPVIASLAL
ncbi:hypothetical protein KIN20_035127 [Parelaphostrongylus tenuis]|uniref:Uncharacterized protein n=1 Tax=Parelaphostrongylus tenuis TaxID=148309 RepID=A0AAD5RBC6_PARTN|nr:hypothetical protein KIN20_035127 [Parelaphostrongylus tenuis]